MDFVIDLSHFTVPSDEPTNHASQFSIHGPRTQHVFINGPVYRRWKEFKFRLSTIHDGSDEARSVLRGYNPPIRTTRRTTTSTIFLDAQIS